MGRMVNLTILAAILDKIVPSGVTLFDLALGPLLWEEQRTRTEHCRKLNAVAGRVTDSASITHPRSKPS